MPRTRPSEKRREQIREFRWYSQLSIRESLVAPGNAACSIVDRVHDIEKYDPMACRNYGLAENEGQITQFESTG